MATTVYLLDTAATTHRGTNTAGLNGVTSGWLPKATGTVRGSGVVSKITNTVAGATNGVEVTNGAGGTRLEWITPPLDADVTIAGTITGNIWALESANAANTAINFYVDQMDAATGVLTRIAKSAFTTELTTGNLARAPTVTATSTAVKKGDRLVITLFGDDAGTMGSGQTFTTAYNGTTAAASGDTYLSFTETFGFQTTDPTPDYGTVHTSQLTETTDQYVGQTANERIAQSFQVGSTVTAASIAVKLQLLNTPTDNLVISIQADTSGSPSGTALASASIAGTALTTTATVYPLALDTPVSLTGSTSYWLVFQRSGALNGTHLYRARYNTGNPYANGLFSNYTAGAWTNDSAKDLYFAIYEDAGATNVLYLTDTASDVATADVDREAWTSRGGSAANDVTNTAAGWTGASLTSQLTQDTDGTFGQTSGFHGAAQSFQLGSTAAVGSVDVYLAKTGTPTDDVVVAIQSESASTPSGTVLASATYAGASLTTTDTIYRVTFTEPVTLTGSTTYWLTCTRSGSQDNANYYNTRYKVTTNPYASGGYTTLSSSDVWGTASSTVDAYFNILGAAHIQVTDTAGGTAVSWFTKPLEAFTLSGLVKVNRRVLASAATANASVGVELARVDEDGTNATVWGYANRDAATTSGGAGEIATTETAYTCYVAGDDLAFTDGQRIRIRLFMDDCADTQLVTAHTVTSYYGGPTGGASGDTYLILGQTLTEYAVSGGATVTPATIATTVAVPQASPQAAASVTPATVSRSVTIDQASAGAATSQTPATIARAVTIPQASPQAGVSVTPATIARSVTVPLASPQLGTSVTPVTVSRAVSVPQSAGGAFASPTPATIARAVTTPQASPQAGASVTPILGGRSVLVPQASPIASSSVTPTTIARTVGIDQVGVTGSLDAYEDEVTTDAPVAWWKLNDASGAAEDFGSGTDADMATNGSPTYGETTLVSVGTNTAVKFDAVGSDYFDTTSLPTKLQISGAYSIEAWVRYTGSPSSLGTVFSERFGDGDVKFMLGFYNGSTDSLKPSFGWYNGAWHVASSADDLATDTTYHLVGTYDGSDFRLYVNGVLKDTEGSLGTQPTGTARVQIGRRWDNSSNEYLGSTATTWVQHVAIYGTALNGTRVAAHYTAGAGAVGATVNPAVIARSVAIDQVTVTAGVGTTVTPAVIARSITVPQASPQVGASVTPATIARSITVNAPTVTTGAGASVTPATVARAVAIPAVTQQLGASVTPAVIARSVTIPEAGYAIGASLTPVTIGRAITVNAPIVTAGGGATRTPDTLAAVVAIDQVVAQVGSVITPAVIARSVLVPQAGPLASSTVTPATIARAVAMGTPTVTTQVSVTPATIARSFVVDQVIRTAGSTASPALIARSFVIGQVAIAAAVSVTPATVARAVAMGTPTVIAGGDVTLVPDTIARAFSVPQASPQAAASITPATVARSLSVPQVAATGASTVSPALIARSVALGQVIITAAASITPATVARAFVIDQAIGGASKTVSPALIARAFAIPQTTTQVGTDANPVVAVIARAFTIPGTGYVTNWVVSATSIALVVTLEEPDIITKPTLIITRSGPKAPGPASGEVLVTGDGAGTPTPAGDVLVIGG